MRAPFAVEVLAALSPVSANAAEGPVGFLCMWPIACAGACVKDVDGSALRNQASSLMRCVCVSWVPVDRRTLRPCCKW